MRPAPAILVLAAGASSRMGGRDKLLEEIDGTPLILRAVRAACAASDEVLVALPAADRSRRAWLGDSPATLLDVEDRAMSASIRAGVAACRAEALLIHLADMPEITAADLSAMADAWTRSDCAIMRATSEDGRPGQPVIFDRRHFPELMTLRGDLGARALLREHPVAQIPLPGRRALIDLDTPDAWTEWRARRDVN
ncbi:nucleotidyltransferase family protein [Jannaschia seohaensis]|uniref:CTP:molybdopterin cytidylyltransferase MocA n=1 Tax=Jannaschia seohaensis TaxID=475081 RepID=A0A2Y9BZL0_9RHOB|nr:nucleotidyltransferase family protein [Jannaschia seohaensis]PWJ20456.1 CTP:molybdopterin cytidylyltransferase MocA [Jannaschia seohaensis]SSA44552.1 CTP:molybdopterin cytidylyltransferase MocA [Jannaschia seohaensis]